MILRDTIHLSKTISSDFSSFNLFVTQEIADIVRSASKLGKRDDKNKAFIKF